MGLCLPLRTEATRVASRPTVFSFASTSHHFRPLRASAFVALWVVPLAMESPAEVLLGAGTARRPPAKLETRLLEEGRVLVKHGGTPESRGNVAGSCRAHKRRRQTARRSPRRGSARALPGAARSRLRPAE